MKNLAMVITLLALCAQQAAVAAEAKSGHGRDHHRQQMREQFGVTEEQFEQMQEIRRNGGSREDAASVLSGDQREQMQAWREQNPRGAGKGRRQGQRPPAGSE